MLHGEGLWKNQSFKICWRHCNKSFFTTLKPSSVFKCRSEVYDFENHFVASFYHNTCHVKRINRFFEKKLFWDTLMLMLVLLEQTSTRQIAVESSEKYHGRTDGNGRAVASGTTFSQNVYYNANPKSPGKNKKKLTNSKQYAGCLPLQATEHYKIYFLVWYKQ